MFGIADYGAFVAAIILFLLIPGPGNLALITSTSKGGIRGGLAATLGVIAGDQVLMWAAVAGVSAVLAAYPAAFKAVQSLVASWSVADYVHHISMLKDRVTAIEAYMEANKLAVVKHLEPVIGEGGRRKRIRAGDS